MTQLTEGQHTGEFILSEAEGSLSRETVTLTVANGVVQQAGTVLGKLTATGKYVPYDNAGGDGSDVAAAVLYDNVDNGDGVAPADFDAVVMIRDCEVRKGSLVWAAGLVDADKSAAYVDLAVEHVIARD
jgi:hypothetical protein